MHLAGVTSLPSGPTHGYYLSVGALSVDDSEAYLQTGGHAIGTIRPWEADARAADGGGQAGSFPYSGIPILLRARRQLEEMRLCDSGGGAMMSQRDGNDDRTNRDQPGDYDGEARNSGDANHGGTHSSQAR